MITPREGLFIVNDEKFSWLTSFLFEERSIRYNESYITLIHHAVWRESLVEISAEKIKPKDFEALE